MQTAFSSMAIDTYRRTAVRPSFLPPPLQDRAARQRPVIATNRDPLEDVPRSASGEYLTGPPPAFQASLLDLQTDIRIQLKKNAATLSWATHTPDNPKDSRHPLDTGSAETGLSDAKRVRPGFQPLNARV